MRNVNLAQTLFEKGKISDYIPEETYEAMAEILQWLRRLETEEEGLEICLNEKFLSKVWSACFGGERVLNIINQSSDIILAFFIITIIMMIIIPVSPWLSR